MHPFEQQPDETDKAFGAFTAYLGLGPERSLSKAAKATGRTKDQLAHWSVRWRWRARALAHQQHLARVERESTEALVREKSHDWAAMHESVRRQAWQEAEDLIALAQDFKARWRDSDRLPDFGALVRALDLAFKLKQFAAGMPSEIKELNTHVSGKVSLEWEAAIRKAYGVVDKPVVDVEEVRRTEVGDQRSEAAGNGVPALPEVKGEKGSNESSVISDQKGAEVKR